MRWCAKSRTSSNKKDGLAAVFLLRDYAAYCARATNSSSRTGDLQVIGGLASTTIDRATYDLQIPSVPQVASVEQTIILELEFVALAQ